MKTKRKECSYAKEADLAKTFCDARYRYTLKEFIEYWKQEVSKGETITMYKEDSNRWTILI
jgi:hypothetical protein